MYKTAYINGYNNTKTGSKPPPRGMMCSIPVFLAHYFKYFFAPYLGGAQYFFQFSLQLSLQLSLQFSLQLALQLSPQFIATNAPYTLHTKHAQNTTQNITQYTTQYTTQYITQFTAEYITRLY